MGSLARGARARPGQLRALSRGDCAAAYRLPCAAAELSKAEKKELRWSQEGLRVRLRLQAPPDCTLQEMLGLTTLREGSRLVLRQRWDVDSRLPTAEQIPFTPTPKQLLYAPRAD